MICHNLELFVELQNQLINNFEGIQILHSKSLPQNLLMSLKYAKSYHPLHNVLRMIGP